MRHNISLMKDTMQALAIIIAEKVLSEEDYMHERVAGIAQYVIEGSLKEKISAENYYKDTLSFNNIKNITEFDDSKLKILGIPS